MSLPDHARVVVTGAGSGLGRAFCAVLAKRGSRIVASDIDLGAAQTTVAQLTQGDAHAARCDVAKLDEVQALAGHADRLLGGIDLLINNAGVAVAGDVSEIPLEDWQWLLGVNLWGVIHGCHVFVPRFLNQGSGHILNVASAAGLLCMPHMGPYNVSKAGVIALSETLRGELAPSGIGVTVLCPTFFPTNIVRASRLTDEPARAFIQAVMDKAKVTAEDVARAALDGVDAGSLYVLPQADGRWLWRLKRLMPRSFHSLARRAVASQARRLGLELPPRWNDDQPAAKP